MPGAQALHLQDVLHDACAPVPRCLPASRCSHVAVPCSSQVHWDRAWIARKVRGLKKEQVVDNDVPGYPSGRKKAPLKLAKQQKMNSKFYEKNPCRKRS